MKKVRLGLIGTGYLGSRHLKTYCEQLSEKAEIVGIYDVNPEISRNLSLAFKVPEVQKPEDLIGKIDAVDICTPTLTHFEIARPFLNNKIHTFIEKPMTLDLIQAQILIDLAEQNNLKLQIGHVERFNAAFGAVSSVVKDPLFIETHRLNRFPNRSLDIGVVMDLMIHDLDIILGLVRSPIQDIQAVGINVLTALEDIANVRLTFENGCVCNLTASRVSDEVVRKIRIFLVDTYISLDYVKQEAVVYKKDGTSISKTSLPIEKEEPLKKELEAFLDCILENKRPLVSGIEGKQALELALIIQQRIWNKIKPS